MFFMRSHLPQTSEIPWTFGFIPHSVVRQDAVQPKRVIPYDRHDPQKYSFPGDLGVSVMPRADEKSADYHAFSV